MLSWASQFLSYYQAQLKFYKLQPYPQQPLQTQKLPIPLLSPNSIHSPSTSLSNHSHLTASSIKQNKKNKKILKKQLKSLKIQQQHLQTTLLFNKKENSKEKKQENLSQKKQLKCLLNLKENPQPNFMQNSEQNLLQYSSQILSQHPLNQKTNNQPSLKQIPQSNQKVQFRTNIFQKMINKALWLIQEKEKEIICYEDQFNQLYSYISDFIDKFQKQNENFDIEKPKRIFIVGQKQCGKKHFINQVLERVSQHFYSQQTKKQKVILDKFLLNRDTVQYLKKEIRDFDQNQRGDEFEEKEEFSRSYIWVEFLIVDGFLGNQGQEILEKYVNDQNVNKNTILMVIYCTEKSCRQFFNNSVLENSFRITLPSIPVTHKLKQLFESNRLSIQNTLTNFLHFLIPNIPLKFTLNCSQSVKNFTVKFLSTKYQTNYPYSLHPIPAFQYLNNYLQTHFLSKLKNLLLNETDLTQFQNDFLQSPENLNFTLSSSTIAHFFNQILTNPTQQSQNTSLKEISLSSLISGLQLLLISCYLYLHDQNYLHSLYINALKLYPFFIMVTKSLSFSQYSEPMYWEFLQKLKEKRLIKFQADKKKIQRCKDTKTYKRKGKKLKPLKDYKNHNFCMFVSTEKIKGELSELQIYQKFFTD